MSIHYLYHFYHSRKLYLYFAPNRINYIVLFTGSLDKQNNFKYKIAVGTLDVVHPILTLKKIISNTTITSNLYLTRYHSDKSTSKSTCYTLHIRNQYLPIGIYCEMLPCWC